MHWPKLPDWRQYNHNPERPWSSLFTPIRDIAYALSEMHLNSDSGSNRRALWVAVIAAMNVVHLWLFFHLSDNHPLLLRITVAIHVIACLGPFWMLADWFVKRRKRLRWQSWMWLFFVPWGFLWYVFEKREPASSDLAKAGR